MTESDQTIEVTGLALAEDQLLNSTSYWRVVDRLTPLHYHVTFINVLNVSLNVYSIQGTGNKHKRDVNPMATIKTHMKQIDRCASLACVVVNQGMLDQ